MQKQKDYEKLKQNVFDLMCGEITGIIDSIGITDEFAPGQLCDRLSKEIYDHIAKISEDPRLATEIEQIQALQYTLLRHLCSKMYDYGYSLALYQLGDSNHALTIF